MVNGHDLERRAGAIEELVRTLEGAGDAGLRATARELVQALMELHRAGLERMLELADGAGEPGQALVERFAGDGLVKHLLVLHSLHPLGLEARVQQAIASARPSLKGALVEGVVVDETGAVIVRLRLEGGAHGCGSPTPTLEDAIRTAMYETAPDVASLVVDVTGAEAAAAAFVPLGSVRRRAPDGTVAVSSTVETGGAHP